MGQSSRRSSTQESSYGLGDALGDLWDIVTGQGPAGCGNSNSDRQAEMETSTTLYDDLSEHFATANRELGLHAGSKGLMGDLSKAIEELTAARDRLNSRESTEVLTRGQAATLSMMAGTAHGYAIGNATIAGLHLEIISGLSAATTDESIFDPGCGSSGGQENTPIPPGGGGC